MLVQESVADRFVKLLVEKTRAVRYGDPFDPTMDMGTVIDEPSAKQFEAVVNEAVAGGGRQPVGPHRPRAPDSPAPPPPGAPPIRGGRPASFWPPSPPLP